MLRKGVIIIFILPALAVLMCGNAIAMPDDCVLCHTMYSNQNGIASAVSSVTLSSTNVSSPCWGCHAITSSNNIDPSTNAPQINHTNEVDLAGGNFAYITGNKSGVTGSVKTRGHNVVSTEVLDDNFSSGIYPPGDEFFQSGQGLNNSTFTCAGKFGCHGDRNISDEFLAVKGAHHSDKSALKFGSINEAAQGISVGTSYRFLLGVKGGEDSDWQATVSRSDHNEYKGSVSGTDGTMTSSSGGTISGFCAECHGDFHGSYDVSEGTSPWKRHPTDISLPGTGTEYANYITYNTVIPVARTIIPNSPQSNVTPDDTSDDIVMCLSCHRAHASPYQDMLRWDYQDMTAGTTGSGAHTGCFVCHSSKDGA